MIHSCHAYERVISHTNCNRLRCGAYCDTLQHTAKRCNTLQHILQVFEYYIHSYKANKVKKVGLFVCCNVLQCVTVCCSVLHVPLKSKRWVHACGAVCCSVLQCVAVHHSMLHFTNTVKKTSLCVCCRVLQCVEVRCSALQCVAVCCSYRSKVTKVSLCVCCSVMQCVAVCCRVLQCAAVCCSVLH